MLHEGADSLDEDLDRLRHLAARRGDRLPVVLRHEEAELFSNDGRQLVERHLDASRAARRVIRHAPREIADARGHRVDARLPLDHGDRARAKRPQPAVERRRVAVLEHRHRKPRRRRATRERLDHELPALGRRVADQHHEVRSPRDGRRRGALGGRDHDAEAALLQGGRERVRRRFAVADEQHERRSGRTLARRVRAAARFRCGGAAARFRCGGAAARFRCRRAVSRGRSIRRGRETPRGRETSGARRGRVGRVDHRQRMIARLPPEQR